MPPKTKRKRQLEASLERAREEKRSRLTGEGPSSGAESETPSVPVEADPRQDDLAQLLSMPEDALDTMKLSIPRLI